MVVPNEQDPLQMSAAIQYVINESANLWNGPLIPARSNIIGYIERILKFQVIALRQQMRSTAGSREIAESGGWSCDSLMGIIFLFIIFFGLLFTAMRISILKKM